MIYDEDYILNRVLPTESGCWEWQACKDRLGYGQVSRKSSGESLAHRLSWRIFCGPPDGLVICHKCDNPTCCNPEHLWAGTQKDNLRDARTKGRMLPKQPWKTTPEIIQEIAKQLKAGVMQCDIALSVGLSRPHITSIKHKLQRENP